MKRGRSEIPEEDRDSKRPTTLYELVKAGDLERVKQMLDEGADANATGGKYETPVLHKACERLDADMVKLLLERRADPNSENDRNDGGDWIDTPVVVAVNHYGIRKCSAIMEESDELFTELKLILSMLKEHGANLDFTSDRCAEGTPLLSAIQYNYSEVVELLLDLGVNPNVVVTCGEALKGEPDYDSCEMFGGIKGQNPLHFAISCYNQSKDTEFDYKIEKLLLDRGCDPNIRDQFGLTALNLAMFLNEDQEHIELYRLLLEHGASSNIPDNKGNTALVNSVHYCGDASVDLLLEKMKKPDLQNDEGKTALHYCCANLQYYHINRLLDRGARYCIADNNGITPYVEYLKQYNEELGSLEKCGYIVTLDRFHSHTFPSNYLLQNSDLNSIISMWSLPLSPLLHNSNFSSLIYKFSHVKCMKEINKYIGLLSCVSSFGLWPLSPEMQSLIVGFCYVSELDGNIKTILEHLGNSNITLGERLAGAYTSVSSLDDSNSDNVIENLFDMYSPILWRDHRIENVEREREQAI